MTRVLTPAVLTASGRANSDFLSARTLPSGITSVQSSTATRPIWDFSRIPLYPVSQASDAAECEADAMAEKALSNTSSPAAGAAARVEPRATSENSGREGRPLDRAARDYFEPRFGFDFGHVRVHDHRDAHEAATGISARAFTVGQNIAFANGQYAPGTEAGRELIAHELAHTIQQRSASAPAGIFRKPIPDWNFERADFAKMKQARQELKIAVSNFSLPFALQQNLLNTLKFVLGPTIAPPATEGINEMDFFHGHLVIKKDPTTAKASKAAQAQGDKFGQELRKARTRAIGDMRRGYSLTEEKIGAYQTAMEKLLPSFNTMLDQGAKVPGAAVMYHTFEFNEPRDLKAAGQTLKSEDPRRHYVTPLDTNQPRRYSRPSGGYASEFDVVAGFSFLVDDTGTVHVRPFDIGPGFTTLELSTITGTTFPEPLKFERTP